MDNKMRYVCGLSLTLLLGVVVVISGLLSQFARADTFSWLQGDITGKVIENTNSTSNKCMTQKVHIGHSLGPEADVCIYQANGWRYGMYSKQFTGSAGNYTEKSFVIGFGSDRAMYKVTGLSDSEPPIYVADSNNLVYKSFVPSSIWGFKMQIIRNLPSKLEKISNSSVPVTTTYRVKADAFEDLIKNESGNPVMSRAVAVSDNGEWMVAELRPGGLLRINMKTYDKLWFSKYSPNYGQGLDPVMEFAVSDDGRHVAIMGLNTQSSLSELNGSCGRVVTVFQEVWLGSGLSSQDISACPTRDLYSVINQTRGGDYKYGHNPAFNSDAGELTMYTYPYNRPGIPYEEKWITLRAAGYTPLQLEYLALGDSYSSGEGDTEVNPATNHKYYRYNTDNEESEPEAIPREKCHVSTRSYPYKLAQDMNLALDSPKQWDTVTCSGATTWDVKEQGSPAYKGQGKGQQYLWSDNSSRLEGYDVETLKTQALNEFIPGRQKQIEFVKKYQPKVITLTIGGNDVDFGGKISDCVKPQLGSCKLASAQGREDLGKELQGQFKNLTALYQDLRNASPLTKIYILSYPQIINGSANDIDCLGYSTGSLDASERRVMAEGYSYINQVIEAAAKYVGVKYIYVEDALNGHRICDGAAAEHYVTGFTFGNSLGPTNERQESFHPNAKGQQAVMDKIKSRLIENGNPYSLLTYPYSQQPDNTVTAPVPTPYLASDTNGSKEVVSAHMTDNSVTKNESTTVRKAPLSFASGSEVDIDLHSDPIDLGTRTVNEDGSLDATIVIPSTVPAGYHTLILSGKTFSGESVQYEQIVFVHGSNLNDIDEDNIPDTTDRCLFIAPSNVDADSDGIDDACDLEMNPPTDPYRIRAGDPSHLYAGVPESPSYLYLERNIYANSATGVSGDHDSDHDGWVVVATSQNSMPPGPYAHFWIDGNESSKTPHVSFRTTDRGCVQYKPADLSRITAANAATTRMFAQEAIDTDTCRSGVSAADLDGDGLSDNTQPLYRARSGNSTIKHTRPDGTIFSEDPNKLYLERNTRAAEAQLGKSDYAANDLATTPTVISLTDTKDYRQSWSMLASSRYPLFTPVNFTKIRLINNYPYVLAGYSSFFYANCAIYRPESTDTIGRTTQYTRQLQLDFMQTLMIQGGCSE